MNSSSFTSLLVTEEPETIRKLGVMAGKIAYFNFDWLYVALLIFNNPEALGVMSFMKTYKKTVIMKLGKFKPRHQIHVPQIALFLQTTPELVDFIEWTVEVGYDNTAKFIIVCINTDRNECDEYAVFESCSKNKITNVVFLRPSNTTDPVAFTYWPVKPGKCYDHQPEKLDLYWDCPKAKCFHNSFPEKLDNLYQCDISVSTFEQHPYMYLDGNKTSGLDGYILEIITKALNSSLKIVIPPEEYWGYYQNNDWSGSMGDIFHDRANFSLCSATLTPSRFEHFQISNPYNYLDLVWVAGSPAEKPSWERIYRPLEFYIRIATFLLFVGIVLTHILLKTRPLKNLLKALRVSAPKRSMFFYSWLLFLGMPLSRQPSKFAVLGIVYSWVWFAFLLRSTYSAALFDTLKARRYNDKFVSFNDVIQSHLSFGGSPTLKEYYTEDKYIFSNWRVVSLDDRYTELESITQRESNFVIAMNFQAIVEYITNFNGTRSVQIIPEKIVNSPIVAFFKKYSPLAAPVSRVLSAVQEGGFAERLQSHFMKQGNIYFQIKKDSENKPLRLEHFAGALAILIIGWVLASIFFLFELFSERLSALIQKYCDK